MKKFLLICFILLSWAFVRGQHVLNGTVSGLANEKVSLWQTFGNDRQLIDTSFLNEQGSFRFEMEPRLPKGMYRVMTESGIGFDLIYNRENIQLIVIINEYDKYVQVMESVENMIYYDFVNLKQKNLLKLDILGPIVEYYPKNDPFYQDVVNKVQEFRKELSERAGKLTANNPETMASHFISVENPVFSPAGLSEEEQKEFLKVHFFDHIDFSDTVLLKSSLLNSRMINYLSLYQDRNADKETFENSLLQGVDTLLEKAMINQEMYEYVVDFLLEGFEAVGFEGGLAYISEHNNLDEFCTNTEKLVELQNKMELINRLAIGRQAPDFTGVTIEGDTIRLRDISADRILLFFWASWCPHCKNVVSDINDIDLNYSEEEIKIIGVSVDTSLQDVKDVISSYHISWPNIAEGKGWEGEIPESYGIAATPTMYLLDENKKIIAKPINKRDLQKALGY